MKNSILLLLAFIAWCAQAKVADNYSNQKQAWQKHQKMQQQSLFKNLQWRNIGPVMQGGRVVSIQVSKQHDNIIYLAYASGGVWKSTDKGITFSNITDQLATQIVGAFAIDPNDDNVLWLGTGENNSSRSSYGGMGVFRSTDAGKTWQYMGLGDSNRIGDMLIDPENSNRIYVAALGSLYSKGGQRGVFISEDSGKTWQQSLKGDEITGFADLSLASNGDIYATSWQRQRSAWNFSEGGKGSKVYKSTNHGKTWHSLTQGLPQGKNVGRMGVAVAKSDSSVVYVVVDNQEKLPESLWDLGDSAVNAKRLKTMSKQEFLLQDEKNIEDFLRNNNFPPKDTAKTILKKIQNDEMSVHDLVKSLKDANSNLFTTDIKGLEVYRSDDAGVSFHKTHDLPLANVVFTYGYYFGKIMVDPNDANTIYTMGVPLIKSSDGGQSWISLYDDKVHGDFHDLWIDARNSKHIIAANDGGADESYDGGSNWRKIDHQPVGQFYTVDVDMEQPYNVYGGLQDNGTLKGSSQNDWHDGESWQRIFGGDGMHVSVNKDTVYVGYQFGNNFRLENGKPSSIKPPNFINEKPLRYNWNTPVLLSTHNPDIIYYGANKLFRSFDKGENYHAISKDLSQTLKHGDVPYGTITSISESPIEFGRLIVGTDDGMVWVTNDDGHTWKNVSKKLPKKIWVSRVIASKYDKNRLWLTLNNYRNDDIQSYVYRSDNFGKSWHDLTKNLPNEAANVIKEDPKKENIVYLGTDKGLYASIDQGSTWTLLGKDFPTVPVHDLIVHPRDNELVAATHGRSIFVTDVSPLQDLNNYKNKALAIVKFPDIHFRNSWNSKPSRWYNTQKPASSQLNIWSDADKTVEITITDANKQKLFKTTSSLHKGLNLWQWDNKLTKDLALNAEKFANKDKTQPLNKSLIPIAEGLRLGHDIYIQKGKYTIHLKTEKEQVDKEFSVK